MVGYNFKEFAKYNKLTNESMNNIIGKISEEEWNKEFNGFFKSIYELCSHIYISDFNWLKRFRQVCDFDVLYKDMIQINYDSERIFARKIFKNINEYIQKRKELDDIIIEFIDELSETDLEKTLKLPDLEGNEIECKMDSLIFHVFNHEIHSRGMISIYLEMLGIENDFS
jgi:uncharacterized damage-inducible protein DinB